jgi:hypothetical protein
MTEGLLHFPELHVAQQQGFEKSAFGVDPGPWTLAILANGEGNRRAVLDGSGALGLELAGVAGSSFEQKLVAGFTGGSGWGGTGQGRPWDWPGGLIILPPSAQNTPELNQEKDGEASKAGESDTTRWIAVKEAGTVRQGSPVVNGSNRLVRFAGHDRERSA